MLRYIDMLSGRLEIYIELRIENRMAAIWSASHSDKRRASACMRGKY